jgi:hypothetical protein
MNRRDFLKGLVAAGALVAANPEIAIEQLLIETKNFSEKEFIDYIMYTIHLHILNPSSIARIDGIVEPDGF